MSIRCTTHMGGFAVHVRRTGRQETSYTGLSAGEAWDVLEAVASDFYGPMAGDELVAGQATR